MPIVNKSFSDIITFTRSTGGGRFNAQGQYEWLPADQPRIDYDPVTGECLGLLVEGARTNYLRYSSDFANALWNKEGVTVGTSTIPSRHRNGFLSEITATATSSEHFIQQVGPTTATSYVAQWVVNLDGASGSFSLMVVHTGGSTESSVASFTAVNGVITAGSKTNQISASGAIDIGGGFYNCRITYSLTAPVAYHAVRLYPENVGVYEGVGRPIFLDVAQLELGQFPTSYIPTTSTTVARAADIPRADELSPWYNTGEGTLFAEVLPGSRTTGNRYIAALRVDATLNNRIEFYDAGLAGNAEFRISAEGASYFPGNVPSAFDAGVVGKVALSYAVGSVRGCANGVLGGSASAPTSLPAPTTLWLGNVQSSSHFNGHVRSIRYYPRKFSDAELQALTA